MPDERVSSSSTTSGGSHGFLYFAIGALIVAVIVLGWMFYEGGASNPDRLAENNAIERSADAIGDAADEIGDAARDIAPDTTPAPAPTSPEPSPAEPVDPS